MLELEQLFPFYGGGDDQLHMAFNFLFVHADLDAGELRAVVEGVEAGLPAASWPVYTGSNHDAGRLATRWCGDDEAKARCALLMLLTLRGTPFLYYGDEIALTEPEIAPEARRDPVPDEPRRLPHADAVDRRAVGRTPGCRWGTPPATSPRSATIPARRCTSFAT